ncbi:MAG: hypothetical protein K6A78_04470 [Prevotella sp.]|nr:hypothetical protein [Prevotella sp.]
MTSSLPSVKEPDIKENVIYIRFKSSSLPYHDIAAKEKAYLYNMGKPNEDFIDLVIGCASVEEKMVLVTENVRHFENIRGINIENWINRRNTN